MFQPLKRLGIVIANVTFVTLLFNYLYSPPVLLAEELTSLSATPTAGAHDALSHNDSQTPSSVASEKGEPKKQDSPETAPENGKKTEASREPTEKREEAKGSSKESEDDGTGDAESIAASEPDSSEAVPDEPEHPTLSSLHRLWDYSAHDDGSLNEWAPGWFVAHHWSEPGRVISSLDVGDVVVVDGTPVTIDSRGWRSADESYESIRSSLGGECVIFQTCVRDGTNNIVLTGTGDGMGPYAVPESTPETVSETFTEEHVTWTNEYGEFDTYEEAETVAEWHAQQQVGEGSSYISGYLG